MNMKRLKDGIIFVIVLTVQALIVAYFLQVI